jgi:hypothetical protein
VSTANPFWLFAILNIRERYSRQANRVRYVLRWAVCVPDAPPAR